MPGIVGTEALARELRLEEPLVGRPRSLADVMAAFGVEGVRAADEELGPTLHDGGDPDVVLAIILEGKNQSISMLETGKTNAGVFSNDKNMGSDSGHAL